MKKFRILRALLLALVLCMAVPAGVSAATVKGTFTTTSDSETVKGGWKKKSGKYYFVTTDGEYLKGGWLKLNAGKYYISKNGYRVNGLKKIKGKYYFFDKKGKLQTGFVEISNRLCYFDPEKGGARTGAGKKKIDGVVYTFDSNGFTPANAYDSRGSYYDAKGYMIKKSTIHRLLEVALWPAGQTLYIWGGGWSSAASTTIGISSTWKEFFDSQSSSYNYKNYLYQVAKGLDCSGYVSWVLYNTFNDESGHGSYLMLAQQMAYTYGSWGFGSYSSPRKFTDHKAGDIMSLPAGHVYIVIGRCSDGSVVLIHSSPKGVMINGTPSSSGKKNSKALKLAKKYMKKYFPKWYAKFPDVSRGYSYLTSYGKMSWYIDKKKSVMSDPEGLRDMSADKVLKVIFNES